MSEPAPFTRETLALMRAEAHRGIKGVAALLGWDEYRVARVARDHGIEVAMPAPPPMTGRPDL